MMKISFAVVAVLALAFPAAAQQSPEAWLIPFAVGYRPDVAGFNASFAAKNLPQAEENHVGWGIELRSLVSGVLVGPMFFRTWDEVSQDSFQLSTDATGIFGEVGLKIAPFSMLTIVPMLGIGGLNQNYHLRKTGEAEFGDLLGGAGRNTSIHSGTRLAGFGALELGLAFNTGSGRYGVALRGGYLYSPVKPGWHLSSGDEVTGAPESVLGGPFATVGVMVLPATQSSSSGF